MVAVSSRFAVLATLCVVASVSYTPLAADAAVVEARHSDKKMAGNLPAEGDTRLAKQPVIPLPHKLSKASVKGATKANIIEHSRTHKNKKKEQEENKARSPVQQSIRLAQFPVTSARSLSRRHHDDDDCPDKVIVNGDRDHVHISCRHDHDHHDHHDHDHPEEVVVNGDRDHVRTRRGILQPRSPRHARPLLQRRNDTTDTGPASYGVVGTVEVQGPDPANGQTKSYGEFLAANQGDHYEIRVSKGNHTSFRMVDTGAAVQSNDSRSGGVFLEAIIPGTSGRLCCTYDASPSSSTPMRLNVCQPDSSGGDGHSSQKFSYDPATGRIRIWAGWSNQTSTAQTPNSTITRRDDVQSSGNSTSGVDMIWLPAQNGTARVEATSGGVQTQTVTVTVTAGADPSSTAATSAAREAPTALADSTGAPMPPSSISSASSPDASSQTQGARASSEVGATTLTSGQNTTSTTQANGESSTSASNELKIEVAPGDSSSSAASASPSSSAAAGSNPAPSGSLIATSPGASWGIPTRDSDRLQNDGGNKRLSIDLSFFSRFIVVFAHFQRALLSSLRLAISLATHILLFITLLFFVPMAVHGSNHHKRAAKALVRRKPTKVKDLQERFSPTAIFPGMTDIPNLTDLSIDHIGHGHHRQTPENTIVPTAPTTPIIVVPTTSTTIPVPVTTSSLTPSPSTTSTPPTTSLPQTTSSTTSFTTSSTSSTIVPDTITLQTTASRSISSAVSSASSAPDSSSSGVSTGAIVGGVGAGIVAVAAIGFAVAFFIRRVRKRELDDSTGFDARDFRRSAVMLTDPPTHEVTVNRGYNPPPPPPMMQQHQVPLSASAWGYAESYHGSDPAGHGVPNQFQDPHPSYSPGHVFNSNLPSPTVTSAPTFVTAPAIPYGQNPLAPAPLSSPYEQSVASVPVLTRQPSNNSTEREILAQSPSTIVAPYPTLTRQPTVRTTQVPADDYVDLSRSSVSPFQAAQYAEISRRLNSPPVPDATSPTIVSPAQIYATQQKDLPPVSPAGSPFSDPEPPSPASTQSIKDTPASESVATPIFTPIPQLASPSPSAVSAEPVPAVQASASPPPSAVSAEPVPAVQASASPPPSTLNVQPMHLSAHSTDSITPEELEFPVPPSPTVSYSSRYRSDTLPPTLPEIKLHERSSVSSYIPGSPMIGSGYISGMTDVSGMSGFGSIGLQPVGLRSEGRFVPAPSPLASSFAAFTPAEERDGGFAEAQEGSTSKDTAPTGTTKAAGTSAASATAESKKKEDKRPETVYDPEDAYGGF
ncbi:hypothetical protein D9756_002169 [Leucocoprinus leucothites]|uniref:Uncharacterized protein n=1 Tax=Leucocoprinus leucothites TaxID=201217 RepID=A0A8H5LLC9_9AGAR|nr:hypothetical protein D9756_002169 [Leucoagaricus leucothites]